VTISWFLTRSAKASLKDIYVHSHNIWGKAQADKYLDGIYETFDLIGKRKAIWQPIHSRYGIIGYQTRFERHQIFWCVMASGRIGIAAVLHTSMLKQERLAKAFKVLP
jgi:toxin ParE1/3/4